MPMDADWIVDATRDLVETTTPAEAAEDLGLDHDSFMDAANTSRGQLEGMPGLFSGTTALGILLGLRYAREEQGAGASAADALAALDAIDSLPTTDANDNR